MPHTGLTWKQVREESRKVRDENKMLKEKLGMYNDTSVTENKMIMNIQKLENVLIFLAYNHPNRSGLIDKVRVDMMKKTHELNEFTRNKTTLK